MSGRPPEREPAGVADAGPLRTGQNGRVVDSPSVTDVAADDAETAAEAAAAAKAEERASVEAAIAELWREVKASHDLRLRERGFLTNPRPGRTAPGPAGWGSPPKTD